MDGAERRQDEQKKKNKKESHVLVIPSCGHGHITPALLLSKELARQGIRVTLISHKPEIDNLISCDDPELKTMGELLQLVGLPRPNVVTASPGQESSLLGQSFKAANLLEQLSASDGPTCLVSDMFVFWSHELALQLRIPRYTFIPCGAILSRFLQATKGLLNEGTIKTSAQGSKLEMFDGKINIPGLPALRYHELVVSCRLSPMSFKIASIHIMAGSGILMNTFYELEASVVDTLRKLSPIEGQKFYPIGPLIQASHSSAAFRGLEDSKEKCIRWLDSQPESSVLYICFGTSFRLKPLQITELAVGLESSQHRFLWVLPHTTCKALHNISALDPEQFTPELGPGSTVLPAGFEARVAERGSIVKGWAPQVQVLSHPSTGGFLTHCGWNSSLEAIRMGVTMLAWPISAEQHLNCRYLVDELKVAYEVPRGADGIVAKEEVDRAVRLFMEEHRMAMRSRMDVLKAQAAAALDVCGSSTHALQELVQDIKNL